MAIESSVLYLKHSSGWPCLLIVRWHYDLRASVSAAKVESNASIFLCCLL